MRPGLPAVHGHAELRDRVHAAVAAGRMPQSLLLHGAEGVGKRTLAFWTAALLQCEATDAPCGACRSCRLAGRFEHPDIHVHFPMPRPKRAATRQKLREALETQRQERLAQLREDPEATLDEDEATGIYLAAVENIRGQASRRPAMGRRSVFVVAEADRMVPQSASPEAANAFLKLLEEPPGYVYLILTSSRPSALLPTIRSRTSGLRVAALREEEVVSHLVDARGIEAGVARAAARRAEGSIGRALRLARAEEDPAAARADRLLAAALKGDAGGRYATAGEFGAKGARAILAPTLDGLEERLRDLLCATSDSAQHALDPDVSSRILRRWPLRPRSVLAAIRAVEDARRSATGNVNPQATVSVLLTELSEAFAGGTEG